MNKRVVHFHFFLVVYFAPLPTYTSEAGIIWKGGMGVVTWSAQERATVLGLLCEQAAMTATVVEHMEVRGGHFLRRSTSLLVFPNI